MTTSTIDIDLSRDACEERLASALIHVTQHPETLQQGTWGETPQVTFTPGEWPCGTVACLFGTGAIQAGVAVPGECFTHPSDDETRFHIRLTAEGVALARHWHRQENLDRTIGWDIGTDFLAAGGALFGLNFTQAQNLSCGDNALQRLWDLAHSYTDGRVSLPTGWLATVSAIDAQRSPS